MILVAGATGNLGREVMKHLTGYGADHEVGILARDPAKADHYARLGIPVRIADYDQPETLTTAFAGVRKLLLISTMSMNRAEQQKRVVDAAVAAGVRHIVYTGLAIRDIDTSGVRDLMISHFQTEDHIRACGVAWTFLRNTMYAEALPVIVGAPAAEGAILLSGGEGQVPYASRAEMGEAAANVLLQTGHEGQTYQITGAQAWSYGEVAMALTAAKHRNFIYQDIAPDTHREALEALRLPPFLIDLTLGTVKDIRDGQYDIVSDDLQQLLGRAPTPLPALLNDLFPN